MCGAVRYVPAPSASRPLTTTRACIDCGNDIRHRGGGTQRCVACAGDRARRLQREAKREALLDLDYPLRKEAKKAQKELQRLQVLRDLAHPLRRGELSG